LEEIFIKHKIIRIATSTTTHDVREDISNGISYMVITKEKRKKEKKTMRNKIYVLSLLFRDY
jgi:hypothetical protein